MEKSAKHSAILAVIFIGTLLFSSCKDSVPGEEKFYFSESVGQAKPEGSEITALSGNVLLDIPAGAVNKVVAINVRQCPETANCPFVLKPINIEPLITFDRPITVLLKYNGELADGLEMNDNCQLEICYWNTEDAYQNGTLTYCLDCCKDMEPGYISFCTRQSGIFAVRIKDNQPKLL